MKRLLLSFLLFQLYTAAIAQHEGHQMPMPAKEAAKPKQKVTYTCSMHPEIKSDKPGTCPKCGMDLIKKKEKASPAKSKAAKPAATKGFEKVAPANKDTAMQHHHHEGAMNMQTEPAMEVKGEKVNMQPGRTIVYHLYVKDTVVNYTGKDKHAYAINGSIPAPTLYFTEGDTAEIYLHNQLKGEETSLHWHGVILPNRFDGVPYLTSARIGSGETHLYKFAVVQNGTYWYHSHSGLQEQAGLYGALVFKRREEDGMQMDAPAMMKEMDMHDEHHRPATKDSTMDKHKGHDMAGMDMSHMDHNMQQIKPQKGNGSHNKEYTVVLSEWTNEKPSQVQRRLRTVNDWYAIKKGSVQSYAEAISAGHFGTKVLNEWKRMNAMDVSDVYYNRFLINGKPDVKEAQYKAGDRVRLRVVNAGASSYFWLQYAGGKLTVVANDGNDVEPIEVDRLIVGVSETYDVVVTIPENMQYEFRATPEDRTKAASLWLGSGMKMPAPVLPRLKYFEGMKMMNGMMKMNGDMKAMGMKMALQKMDMNRVMYDELKDKKAAQHDHSGGDKSDAIPTTPQNEHQQHNLITYDDVEPIKPEEAANMMDMQGMDMGPDGLITLNYDMLRATHKTILPDVPYKELHFTLTGNMNRYVWSINNKVVSEWDKILIEKGQNVRIIMFNNSMMRHPMHLHGHDFRVLNGKGEYAPLKNVLDIMPMETDTIEFAANQSGDWFFHCHILYHMMAGMGNVFSYKNSPPNPELPNAVAAFKKFKKDNRMIHPMAEISLQSNGSDGMFMLSNERYALQSEWHIGLNAHHGQESETYFGRYLGKMQWWFPFVGFDYHHNSRENDLEKNSLGQLSNQSNRKAVVAGVQYTSPMLVVAEARVDSKGKFRFQMERDDVPLSSRLRFNFMANTDKEYTAGLNYILRKWLALSTHYDSDMGYGAGIKIIY